MTALQLTLGSDTYDYKLAYVNDIIVHSTTFEFHLMYFDTAMSRQTRAGFTVNAGKCAFCNIEIAFLGHVIRQGVVSPDPRRTEAILNYLAPRNQRQLCQFLGTANYYHRFGVRYASYVAALLPLLKKGNKWNWSSESQKAFVKLRDKFANSIHLLQPEEKLSYTTNTDANGRAIGGLLMQTNRDGETQIVSTASRELTQTGGRYSVAEQELLAIVFALDKFRTYVFGYEVYLRTDNKDLSFSGKCALTSHRIARCRYTYLLHGTESFLRS